MQFTCTRENIVKALSFVSGIASKQNHLPILANILIKASESRVDLIATDLDVAVTTALRARVVETGSFTVPAKTLSDYVGLLSSEQVDIGQKGNELLVTSGGSSTKIKGEPADEYPVIPEIIEEHPFTLLAEPLRESLAKVVFAAARNEIRPELSGIYFGLFTERYAGLVLAATDSYRLVEKRMSISGGQDAVTAIVPSKTIHEIIRVIAGGKPEDNENQVRLWIGGGQLAIRYGACELTSRLVEGDYPDYTQIIPERCKTTATVPTHPLENSIKAASLFTTSGVNAVSVDVSPEQGLVSVSSSSTQTGEHTSSLDAVIKGEENSTLLNPRYVLDGLGHMGVDEVIMELDSGDTPCLFRPKGRDDYLYIVMPIRR